MKATIIVRKVYELGRIVLTIILLRILNIKIKDPSSIFVEDDAIVLKKYEPACIFCGNAKNVVNVKGKNICRDCIEELKRL